MTVPTATSLRGKIVDGLVEVIDRLEDLDSLAHTNTRLRQELEQQVARYAGRLETVEGNLSGQAGTTLDLAKFIETLAERVNTLEGIGNMAAPSPAPTLNVLDQPYKLPRRVVEAIIEHYVNGAEDNAWSPGEVIAAIISDLERRDLEP